MTSNLPFELINLVMSFMSSPTAILIRNFTEQVQANYEGDIEDYDHDRDFRFAVWSNEESDMKNRYAIQDSGIIREGVNY